MQYLYGAIGLAWMTIVFCGFCFPITIPILLVFRWLMWIRPSTKTRGPIPKSVMIPIVLIAVMLIWGAIFSGSPRGPWDGYRWPATVALGLFAICWAVAWRIWRRSGRNSRVMGLLVVQLWFGVIALWVVAAAVSPGSGLGAL